MTFLQFIFIFPFALFFIFLVSKVANEYIKDWGLKGWQKIIGFAIVFIFVALIFYLFSGNVAEWGR